MNSNRISIILATIFLAGLGVTPAFTAEQVREIDTRDGVTIKFIEDTAAGASAPTVILFMGGNGRVRLNKWDGSGNPVGNFLVRSRGQFAKAGFNVAVPDAPSDRLNKKGLIGSRSGAKHAQDITAVIAHMRKKSSGKMFLIGTSRGTISAAGVGARLPADVLGGIVLTATVTRANNKGNADSVTDADLKKIKVPVLFAHHKDDSCYVCVPGDIGDISKKLVNAPTTKTLFFEGGDGWRGNPCGSKHAHGFLGIEDKVVADIAAWIKSVAHGGKP